jgi:hypothetical protein
MKTLAHTTTILAIAVLLGSTTGCKEHNDNVSAPKTDLGMNGFEDITNGGGGVRDTLTIPWDSVTISMGASTIENVNDGEHLLGVWGIFTPLSDKYIRPNLGMVILSSAQVFPSEVPISDSTTSLQYSASGGHLNFPEIARPLFGRLTKWKVPQNTYGIEPLDTMLYTLSPLNVRMIGQQEIYLEERIATTGTLVLTWQPDAQADWVRVDVTYDGSEPSNRDRNQPADRRAFRAVLPGNADGINIPPDVLGKLPPRSARIRITVERERNIFFRNGKQYVRLTNKNMSRTTLLTL